MTYQAIVGARLGISGTLECRDAAGRVIKTIDLSGAVPLEDIGLSVEDARKIIDQQGELNEPHDRE